tara:strand:+ start:610 stop:2535 length:1926 start_codon:yes stop_codon:yes gene_type:complete
MKKLLLILLCLPLLTLSQSGCTHNNAVNYNPEAKYDDGSCEYDQFPDIGSFWQGGIVFDVDVQNRKVLIAGIDFVKKSGSFNTANSYCNRLIFPYGRYDDWLLPDIKTLNLIYQNIYVPSIDFKGIDYWSSTPGTRMYFLNGTVINKTPIDNRYHFIPYREAIISIKDYSVKSNIQDFVEKKVNEWQEKGEFEKTTEYLVRVNEINRNNKIKKFQKLAVYNLKSNFLNSIDFSNVELGEYDADNETFLIKDRILVDFVISVPISEAKELKENFSLYNFLNPYCVIIDDRLRLSYVELKIRTRTSIEISKIPIIIAGSHSTKSNSNTNPKIYTYNLSNTQDYAITDIEYDFSSIEIENIFSVNKIKSSNISTNKIKVGSSSVNLNIPTNSKVKNRYALVIGNEDYTSFQRTLSSEQNVDYAVNDASIFKKYCLNTLGVEEDNMFFLINATAGQMSQEIDLISKILSKLGDEAELIVYYAGHGFPDELTKIPYLIPVDVSATNLSSAIKLSEIYTKLSSTGASKVTVFLDACFTGGGRNSGLVASRGVKVKPKEGSLNGNLLVFSASSEDQSALPCHDEGHGMFTYHLLRKLQETKGDVSMGELSDYLEDSVSLQSLKENKKEQDPKVNTSSKVINDWRNWKF